MTNSEHTASGGRQKLTHLLVGMVMLGALWGMIEVILGGSLGAADFPYRAGVLTGIGLGILALGFAIWRNPLILIGAGVIAALVNLIGVPILHLSVMCKANSCIAIIIEAASLSLIFTIITKKAGGNAYARMAIGASAALLASVGFYLIGTHAAPCQYLLSFSNAGAFVVNEGLIWAAFSASLVPLGYFTGEKLAASSLLARVSDRKLAYYTTALVVIVFSLGMSSLAIIAGL